MSAFAKQNKPANVDFFQVTKLMHASFIL